MSTSPIARDSPRLVATDLDGTLLRSDGTVSDRTRSTLQRVSDSGVPIVLVTGRPTRMMRPVAEAVGHTGLAVCANGAVVYDLENMQTVDTFTLAPEHSVAVADAVREALPDTTFAVELMTESALREHSYPGLERVDVPVSTLADMLREPVVKLLIRHPEMDPDTLLLQARKAAGSFAEFTHSSHDGLLEVSATGITKASTLAVVADRFGLEPHQVVAFGDMPNDLPMLAWAGHAYSMPRAHPEVLASVDLRAPSNDDDGVAQVLEDLYDLPAESCERD